MGKNQALSPKSILVNKEIITNPKEISEAKDAFHKKKFKELRNKSPKTPKVYPVKRLQNWMKKSGIQPPMFSLKQITLKKLDQLMTRLKPGKNLPDDTLDGFILKSIYPLIKDGILNIVNLSL